MFLIMEKKKTIIFQETGWDRNKMVELSMLSGQALSKKGKALLGQGQSPQGASPSRDSQATTLFAFHVVFLLAAKRKAMQI